MPLDVSSFFVDQVIVHDVGQNDGVLPVEKGVTLTDAAVPDIDAARKNFFRERINRSLSGRAFHVVPDPDQASSVPTLVAELLADPDRLVATSQEMARLLYSVQNKVNNEGLLTVILGRIGDERCVSILKLQRHEALHMQLIEVDAGKTFSAEIFDDLTLNDETRVFKASLFRADEPDADAVEGLVSDEQRGYDPRTEVANFFLSGFLGCRLKTAPEVVTKDFYTSSHDYFDTLPDEDRRREYAAALAVQLRSPATTIRPSEFAQAFLRTADRQGYVDYLEARGIPDQATDKDTRLIDARLKTIGLRTEAGIRITGPPDVVSERVSYEKSKGQITIRDDLKDVSS